MNSWTAVTEEMDDLEDAVKELASQIPMNELKKNTVGIVFTCYDLDYEALSAAIDAEFDFPVMGASTMALLSDNGYTDNGINMLVLSADDVTFVMGMTDELTVENFDEKMKKTYTELSEELGCKEDLIISYAGQVTDHIGESHVSKLDELADGALVYGGLASDMVSFDDSFVFFGGEYRCHGQVMLLMAGNIKPIYIVEFSVSAKTGFHDKVTKSDDNLVYEIGDKSFVEALDEAGLYNTSGNVIMEFVQTPFVATIEQENGDSVEVLRSLTYINEDTGAGMFLGRIPEGSNLRVSTIRGEDIQSSVKRAFDDLGKRLASRADEGYRTILCTSCVTRYMNLAGDRNLEGKAYSELLPDNIHIAGMYSYGEFCPTRGNAGEKYHNMFHNSTFTMLLI